MVNLFVRLKSIFSKINFFKLPPRVNRIRSLSLSCQTRVIAISSLMPFMLISSRLSDILKLELANINSSTETIIILLCFSAIVCLICFIKLVLIDIKRLHDFNFSGWWVVLSIIPIISSLLALALIFISGTKGDNKFGPQPPKASKLDYILAFLGCILYIVLSAVSLALINGPKYL